MRGKRPIALVTGLLLLVIPIVLLCWGFLCPVQYGDTFLGELKYKVDRLAQAGGERRIILAGGSGVAFGVDSALIERELPGYTVVNFGMYAALGTTVMLDLSQELIRPGDIVILLPEQQEQALSDFFDPAVMWQGVDGAFGLLSSLPGGKLARMAGSFPAFAAEKFSWYLRGAAPQPQEPYRRASFNGYGDIVSAACARNVMPGGYDADAPIRFDGDMVSDAFVERVNAYAAALEERGAVLWYGFCPMNALAVEEGGDPEPFYAGLRARLACPIVGDPRDSILAPEWFYDTNFHLNASGKTVYTQLLIRSIKAMLGDSSPTQIALPQPPELAAPELSPGDDSDGDCFLYERTGDALTVTGLSPRGLEREALTVPAAWEGLPVAAIGPGAFSGAEGLREIVIQGSIAAIADGAFADCPALERIVLESARPSGCRVGRGLLEGTRATVLVPAEALSDYRTDYFWSVHGSRVQPNGP